MKMRFVVALAMIGLAVVGPGTGGEAAAMNSGTTPTTSPVSQRLGDYVAQRIAEFDQIDDERREALGELADFVRSRARSGEPIDLTFVCTHNSRRSHMAMIWAAVASAHFGVDRVTTYSGGTETTAFNPRAVAAIERSGMLVERTTEAANPIYHVRFDHDRPALTCFSKVFDLAPNPAEGFAAVMVCGSADDACPVVEGCSARFAITYEDPKAFDGTEREAGAYDERCRQIAREMLYVFSRV